MTDTIKQIDSDTLLYCIFGNPVRHSLSPVIHNLSFKNKEINAVYLAFEPESIGDSIKAMRSLGISGASVTIPFKVDAMNYLDELDPLAENIGSINTIHNIRGKLKGYNTDGYGAVTSLRENGVTIEGSGFLIIGNGGSARSIGFTLLQEGGKVVLAGRNRDRIEALRDDLKKTAPEVESVLLDDLDTAIMKNNAVIINTTPIGMHPDTDSLPLREDLIRKEHTVFDIVYSPENTRLLETASVKGCRTVRGLDMLINQGVKQFEIWTGETAPVELIKKELKKLLY
jgi:shikimate dehydrogenase